MDGTVVSTEKHIISAAEQWKGQQKTYFADRNRNRYTSNHEKFLASII